MKHHQTTIKTYWKQLKNKLNIQGTVNHETGIITLSGLNYRGILDGTKFINLVVKYLDQDVVPNKTQIVSIYPSDITVTMIKDTTDWYAKL